MKWQKEKFLRNKKTPGPVGHRSTIQYHAHSYDAMCADS